MNAFEIVAICAGVSAILGSSMMLLFRFGQSQMHISNITSSLSDLIDDVESIKKTLFKVNDGISDKLNNETKIIQIASLSSQIEKLESEIKNLKILLFSDPETTITIPIIKKDIDFLNRLIEDRRKDIERLFNMSKWYIGIIITMAIGLLSITLSIILKV